MDEVLSHFGKGDWLVMQNEINHLPYLMERAPECGLKLILNPSPMDSRLQECDLSKISLFILNVVDTTGAGDTFSGFFIAEYLRTGDPAASLRLAGAAAAIAISRPGAAAAVPDLEEVRSFFSE